MDQADAELNPEAARSFIAQQESMLKAFKEGQLVDFKGSLRNSLWLKEQEECTICITDLLAPCAVTVLGCNKNHVFHSECINMWIEKTKRDNEKKRPQNRLPPTCPICRKVIAESQMCELMYKGVVGQEKKGNEDKLAEGAIAKAPDVYAPDVEMVKVKSDDAAVAFGLPHATGADDARPPRDSVRPLARRDEEQARASSLSEEPEGRGPEVHPPGPPAEAENQD